MALTTKVPIYGKQFVFIILNNFSVDANFYKKLTTKHPPYSLYYFKNY